MGKKFSKQLNALQSKETEREVNDGMYIENIHSSLTPRDGRHRFFILLTILLFFSGLLSFIYSPWYQKLEHWFQRKAIISQVVYSNYYYHINYNTIEIYKALPKEERKLIEERFFQTLFDKKVMVRRNTIRALAILYFDLDRTYQILIKAQKTEKDPENQKEMTNALLTLYAIKNPNFSFQVNFSLKDLSQKIKKGILKFVPKISEIKKTNPEPTKENSKK